MGALVADPGLAALAGVAGRAAARVRALPSVPAGGAVLARPGIGGKIWLEIADFRYNSWIFWVCS